MASTYQPRQKTVMSQFVCCIAAFESACQWLHSPHSEPLTGARARSTADEETHVQCKIILQQADRFKLWAHDFRVGSDKSESPLSERDPNVIFLLEKLEQELDIRTHWKVASDDQYVEQNLVDDSWQFLAIEPSEGEDTILDHKVIREIIDELYEFSNNCQLQIELSDASKISDLQPVTKNNRDTQKLKTRDSSADAENAADSSNLLIESEFEQSLLGFQSQRDFDTSSFGVFDSQTFSSSDTSSIVGSEFGRQASNLQKDDASSSQTRDIDPVYLELVTHNHRAYQKYSLENRINFTPVDEDEMTRLKEQHEILQFVFDNRLIFPPMNNPRRVLECGYGAGSWAIDVAIRHPQCMVVAVDIYPYKGFEIPKNLYLQLDDLNKRFTFPTNHFDITHSQLMLGGINANRWPSYIRDMFRVTRLGGWCQMVDIYYQWQSDSGSLSDSHALRQWSMYYFEAYRTIKNPRIPLMIQSLYREAGFVDVEQTIIPLPSCAWSSNERANKIGFANRTNAQHLLSSLALYPFTNLLGMDMGEVQLLISQARNEAMHPDLKAYLPL